MEDLFHGTDEPLAVVALALAEGEAGLLLKEGVEGGRVLLFQPGAQLRVGLGLLEGVALGHCPDIKSRSAHQKGRLAAAENIINGSVGVLLELGHRIALVGGDDVQ